MAGPYGQAFSGGYKRSPLAEALGISGANLGRGIENAAQGVATGITNAVNIREKRAEADRAETLERDKMRAADVQRIQSDYENAVANGADPAEAARVRDEQIGRLSGSRTTPRSIAEVTRPKVETQAPQAPAAPQAPQVAPAPSTVAPSTVPKSIADITNQPQVQTAPAPVVPKPDGFGVLIAGAKEKEKERLTKAEADRNARELTESTRTAVFTAGLTPDIVAALPVKAREIYAADPELKEQGNAEKMLAYVKRYQAQQQALRDARAQAANKEAGDRTVASGLRNNYRTDTASLVSAINQKLPALESALNELAKNPNDNNAAQLAVKTYIKLYDEGLVTGDEFRLAGTEAGLDMGTMIDRWRKNASGNILSVTNANEIRRGAKVMADVLRGALQSQNDRYAALADAEGVDAAKIGMVDPYAKPKEKKPKTEYVKDW